MSFGDLSAPAQEAFGRLYCRTCALPLWWRVALDPKEVLAHG
jgi:hypothetical protein